MTGQLKRTTWLAIAVATASALAACRARTGEPSATEVAQIVLSVRTGPQSFNWFTHHDLTTHLVSILTQARLVRINAVTQELEPALAESWTRSDDGRRYTVALRRNVRFADGAPFTAADVVFSVAAAFDKTSMLADVLTFGGQPLRAEAIDPDTVALTFPQPYGPGLRVLDTLPILPKHRLQDALARGEFGAVWGASADPASIIGLGPFVLKSYRQGEGLTFERNPHYFRRDGDGSPLPRLDRLILQILPDQDAQMLALEAGQNDGSATEIRPVDYAAARRLAEAKRVQLLDLGVGMNPDALWFNLKPGAFDGDSRRSWIQRDELRQAISLAIDRQRFVDIVYAGAGVPVHGPITAANRKWSTELPGSVSANRRFARARLAAVGLVDRDGDGWLDDDGARHARFTVMTQGGQASLERGASAIRDQLATIGLQVDVVPMDAGALIQRFLSGSGYDAVYFNLITTDTDPASQIDFWTSRGSSHVWNLGAPHETLAWEREIDQLMGRQSAALDERERVELFRQVQLIFAAHLPMVHFAAPRVFVATSTRLTGLNPAVTRPQLLWAADTIALRH